MNASFYARGSEKGIAAVFFTISMVALVAMVGLALDVGHAYFDDTRLQNVIDSTALSCAKTLDITGDTYLAQQDALSTYGSDLPKEIEDANLAPIVEFSSTLDPFVVGSTPPRFCRVRVDNFSFDTWFAKILGRDTLSVRVSAVSGPIRLGEEICNLSPFLVCGTPPDDTSTADCGPSGCCNYDGGTVADDPCCDWEDPSAQYCYGFEIAKASENYVGDECYLKTAAVGQTDSELDPADQCGVQNIDPSTGEPIGGGTESDTCAGNFQIIAPECPGADCMREAFSDGACLDTSDPTVPSQTGNIFGPVRDVVNSLFGEYGGTITPEQFPQDTDIVSPNAQAYFDPLTDPQKNDQRIKGVVIGDCSNCEDPGQHDIPILTVGCFLFARPVRNPPDGDGAVWGQLVGDCSLDGEIAPTNEPDFLLHKIVLYKDPDSPDS
jgi:hypothetical protein